MAEEFYIKGFKEMLKQYFFYNPQVEGAYPTIDSDKIDTNSETDFSELSNNSKKAREYGFNRFFRNIMNEPILNAEGKPYPVGTDGKVDLDKVAYDFFLGKEIVFKGCGQDGMVKVQTKNNAAYRSAITGRNAKDITINPDNSKIQLDIKTRNYDPATDIKDKYPVDVTADPEKVPRPKKLGWWNKIVKAFTGHSCKSWEKYDKAQELLTSKNAISVATSHAQNHDVLDDEAVAKDYRRVEIDQMKIDAEKKVELQNDLNNKKELTEAEKSFQRDVTQTIMDSYTFNKETQKFELKDAYEAKMEKKAKAAEKEQKVANNEPKKEEIKKEEPKPEVKRDEPKAPEKPLKEDPHASQRKAGGEYFRKNMLGDKFDRKLSTLYYDNVDNHDRQIDKVKAAYEKIEAFADPNNEKTMTKEELADNLATVYLGYSMYENIDSRKVVPDSNTETIGTNYRTALEGVKGMHGLHEDLKAGYLKHSVLDDAMKNPDHLLDYVLGGKESMKKLGMMTEQIMGKDIVDEKATELLDAQYEKEKAAQKTERQPGMYK